MPNNKMAQAMVTNSQREKEWQEYLKQTQGASQMTKPQWMQFNYGKEEMPLLKPIPEVPYKPIAKVAPKSLKRGYGLPRQRAIRMERGDEELAKLRQGGD